ncbi:phosphotransferase [Thermosipho melanesiensis]|nr:phosphotransferase [Thermosipho melanesiensis]OOC38466.1 phosphotransferase [Thermosipho melanesiensis]OOC38928.1 phosphotransferase [Thermosipho melanesiensis]OOC41566.1 phosphotransferase [Thermosipho melanesiensis]OOC44055.1 phosphotransferase [Thermosipho melanesiensis]
MVPGEVFNRSPDVIAICDHNSGGNVRAFKNLFERKGKLVIPGIEIQTVEDIHILGYFLSISNLERLSLILKDYLPKIFYDPEKFGYQIYVDENDNFLKMEKSALGFPTELSLEEVVDIIQKYGGLPVYAHIGRKFGVLYQLGIFPNLPVKICEVTNKEELNTARKNGYIALSSSDAHFLEQIGVRYSIIDVEKKDVNSVLGAIISGRVKTIWDF